MEYWKWVQESRLLLGGLYTQQTRKEECGSVTSNHTDYIEGTSYCCSLFISNLLDIYIYIYDNSSSMFCAIFPNWIRIEAVYEQSTYFNIFV